VRGHVGKLARAVSGRGDDLAAADQHRSHRNLAALAGGFRLAERGIHELRRFAAHLASSGPF
jgi:hypothetical protein